MEIGKQRRKNYRVRIEEISLDVVSLEGRGVERCHYWFLRGGELDLYLVKNSRLTLVQTIRNVVQVSERL